MKYEYKTTYVTREKAEVGFESPGGEWELIKIQDHDDSHCKVIWRRPIITESNGPRKLLLG